MGNRTLASGSNLICVLAQRAAAIGVRRRGPAFAPLAKLGLPHFEIQRATLRIDGNHVAIPDERERSTDRRLRTDVTDAEAARATGKAPVGDQRHLVTGPLSIERGRGREHLAHAGPALGTLVADDEDVAIAVVARLDRRKAILLAVEDACGTAKDEPAHARNLDDRPLRRQRSRETDDPSRRRYGIGNRIDNLLILIKFNVLKVLLDGLAGDREAVLVQIAPVEQRAHQLRNTADVIDVLGDVAAGGFQIGNIRRALEDGANIKQIEGDPALVGHGRQVQTRIGRPAGGGNDRRRVLEGLSGGNVAGAYAIGDKTHDRPAARGRILVSALVGRRRCRRAGQRQPDRFGYHCHCIGGELSPAGAGAWAGHALELV